MQKVRYCENYFTLTAYKITSSGSISQVIYFLFTFHSRYSTLSLLVIYLALEDGTPLFKQGRRPHFTYLLSYYTYLQGFHLLRKNGIHSYYLFQSIICIYYNKRLIWFHSPLLPESRLISFPIGTVMFYFPTYYFLSHFLVFLRNVMLFIIVTHF